MGNTATAVLASLAKQLSVRYGEINLHLSELYGKSTKDKKTVRPTSKQLQNLIVSLVRFYEKRTFWSMPWTNVIKRIELRFLRF